MDKFLNIKEKPIKTNILELINKKDSSEATESTEETEATEETEETEATEATEETEETEETESTEETEATEETESTEATEETESTEATEASEVTEEIKNKLLDQEMENLEKDFKKIDNRKRKKTKKEELLLRIFKILNYDVDQLEELTSITIQRDLLKGKKITEKILELVPELREVYNSAYLTCLHDNSIYKQKFPVINLVRQILKCNFFLMTPKVVSNGYEKVTGKKIVTRIFVIEKELF